MIPAEIIAYRTKRHGARERKCACGRASIDYLPERVIGSITHGASVCVRYGKEAKP